MTKILQSATHDINTAFGKSIENYSPKTPPFKGSGQGHVAGPTIRVMVCAILLTILRDEDFGVDALLYVS